jgi:predicted kinase
MSSERSGQRAETESLVVVCGYPGVGKTTVAETVSDRLGGEMLRTDVVRKELVDDPQYTDEETETVYEEVLQRSRRLIEDGTSVVLDGTFFKRDFRERADEIATQIGAELEFVRVQCDEETVEERIRQRNGISDADVEVYRMHRDIFDPLDRDHVTVDNSEDLEDTRRQVLAHF